MGATPHEAFSKLLRRYRRAAGLTQEELAERAGVSADTISNIERGLPHIPRKDTLHLLAHALDLSPQAGDELYAAARSSQVASPRAGLSRALPDDAEALPLRIPLSPTPLIGRDALVEAVITHLHVSQQQARLLTLTGSPGVGKTRLALEAAAQLQARFADGASFVPLAPVVDANQVDATVASALGIRAEGQQPIATALAQALRARELLLVLDNFEHLTTAAPLVAELLAACPALRVLVTSRAPLHLRAEQAFPVPPLELPDLANLPPVAMLAQVPAVALFVARARACAPDFELTPANSAEVAAICHRLDGMPLALELAAARIPLLPPHTLLAQLTHRLAILTSGALDLPPRQRSLRATLDWSYDLLTEAEQALFRGLAVFMGGWTIESAEAVCAGAGIAPTALLDTLAALLERHLIERVLVEEQEPRYGMLETMHEYAWEQLAASQELTAWRSAHAAFFLAFVETAEPALKGAEQDEWLERIEREQENLRAALRWAVECEDASSALRLTAALWSYWLTHGDAIEGRHWLERAIALADACGQASEPTVENTGSTLDVALAATLNGAGVLATHQGDFSAAQRFHDRALALRRRLGDVLGIASALNSLGGLAIERGDFRSARAYWQESLSLRQQAGDIRAIALAMLNLGVLANAQGDFTTAAELLERSVEFGRAGANSSLLATALVNLGDVAREQGDPARATQVLQAGLTLARQLGQRREIAKALYTLGHLALQLGDVTRAVALYEECLPIMRDMGEVSDTAHVLSLLGAARCEQGDFVAAETLQREALRMYQGLDFQFGIAEVYMRLGHLARRQGDWHLAASFYLAGLAQRDDEGSLKDCAEMLEALACTASALCDLEIGARLGGGAATVRAGTQPLRTPHEQAAYTRMIRETRDTLGEADFTLAWQAGEALPWQSLLAEARMALLHGETEAS